jgi:hypothetical protein
LTAELCAREGCDGRVRPGHPPLVIRQFEDYGGDHDTTGRETDPDGLSDVVMNLCSTCRRALAKGLWTPTRQELIKTWRPTEKQIHPVVQGALNRDHFYVPPFQWLKEIRVGLNIIDLACFAWKQGYSEEDAGIHAFEVKMKDNGDNKRLKEQLGTMLDEFHFAWLIRVDKDPEWEVDKRVGLMRYDLQQDKITRIREATRLKQVKFAPPYRHFQKHAESLLDRVKAQGSMKDQVLEVESEASS